MKNPIFLFGAPFVAYLFLYHGPPCRFVDSHHRPHLPLLVKVVSHFHFVTHFYHFRRRRRNDYPSLPPLLQLNGLFHGKR